MRLLPYAMFLICEAAEPRVFVATCKRSVSCAQLVETGFHRRQRPRSGRTLSHLRRSPKIISLCYHKLCTATPRLHVAITLSRPTPLTQERYRDNVRQIRLQISSKYQLFRLLTKGLYGVHVDRQYTCLPAQYVNVNMKNMHNLSATQI